VRSTARRALLAALTTGAVWVIPGAALAHGVGVRGDLPLPLWAVSYGAVGVLVITFVTLLRLWPDPRFEGGHATRSLPTGASRAVDLLEWPVRLLGLALLGLTLAAALVGSGISSRNPAPFVLYVGVWVGVAFAQPLIGDVWRWLNPFETVAIGLDRLDLVVEGDDRVARWGHWPAVATMLTYLWLELVYTEPADPRAVGGWLALYVALVVLPGAFLGGAWVRAADSFGVFFSLLAAIAPFHRDEDGRIALRAPIVGLADVRPRPGTAALILVVLGGTTFDGVTRTDLWTDRIRTTNDALLMLYGTVGLLATIAVVWGLYRYAVGDAAALTGDDKDELTDDFVHSLVPIALGYAVAHYFSLLVFEGQRMLALLSDPFDTGADLLGTADWSVDFTAVSTTTIGVVQVAGIVLGHVAGVVLAHDRAVARFAFGTQKRAQQGMLVAMVTYTVGGLLLLLGA